MHATTSAGTRRREDVATWQTAYPLLQPLSHLLCHTARSSSFEHCPVLRHKKREQSMDEEEQARGAPEVTPPYSAHQDQARRIEALRTLAQANTTRQGVPSSPERVRLTPRSPARRMAQRRLVWLSLVAVLVFASVAGFIVYRTHAPSATGLPATLTLDLKAANAACPADMSWSPDARQLAVMASGSDCLHSNEQP